MVGEICPPPLIEIGIIYVQKMGRTSSPHVPVRSGGPDIKIAKIISCTTAF